MVFLIMAGVVASVIWLLAAKADRKLVVLYRKHVKTAFEKLREVNEWDSLLKGYEYVGQPEETQGADPDWFSITKLPLWVACFFGLAWIIVFVALVLA
jgi:hypothetical protein